MKATEEEKQRMHKWYLKNREMQIRKSKEWKEKHKNDLDFKKRRRLYYEKYSEENKEKIKMHQKQYKREITEKIFTHYSNGELKCRLCGFSNIFALTLDHIHGGGSQHRKSVKRAGVTFYQWLIKNGYPEGYQVLCMNCQFIKMKTNDRKV